MARGACVRAEGGVSRVDARAVLTRERQARGDVREEVVARELVVGGCAPGRCRHPS